MNPGYLADDGEVKRAGEQINDGGDEKEQKKLHIVVIKMPSPTLGGLLTGF
jgi:hypothetical protein